MNRVVGGAGFPRVLGWTGGTTLASTARVVRVGIDRYEPSPRPGATDVTQHFTQRLPLCRSSRMRFTSEKPWGKRDGSANAQHSHSML